VGFTMIVKVCNEPVHEVLPFAKVGVTSIVAIIGAEVVLVAVKEILPFPLAVKPIFVLLLVQA